MVNNMYHMCTICNYQCTMFGDLWTLWSSILNKWVYIHERTFTYTLQCLAPMIMGGVMTMENQTTAKATPQHRSPQSVSYSLYCIHLLQFITNPLWSTAPTVLLDWPAVHHGTGPVNQPQPIPACVAHVCYLTTARAPAGTVKKTTLVCIMGWNWIKYNNEQIVQSVIYSTCIGVSVITNLMKWTPKGILHIHPLTTLEDIGVCC